MPGVPTGRGCDACRRQKKKCDQKTPCSRCERLNISCVGAGQRRFKFKTQVGGSQDRSSSERSSPGKTESGSSKAIEVVPRIPSSERSTNISAFVATIHRSTDMKFNLMWAYGGYLIEIPRRLAHSGNDALEAAVAVLVSAHQDVCVHRSLSSGTMNKYARALRTLRTYLDDSKKASTVETLCAVNILLICQSFMGGDLRCSSAHGAGAVKLLKARKFYDPSDKFESMLLLALRGPVVVEGIFNPEIQLTSDEWKSLVENHLDRQGPDGQMLYTLARIPEFIKRGRLSVQAGPGAEDHDLLLEMWAHYYKVHDLMMSLREQLDQVEQGLLSPEQVGIPPNVLIQSVALVRRSYGFALMTGIIVGTVLNAAEPEDAGLEAMLTDWAKKILELSELVAVDRPVWASYMSLYLVIAWIGTSDVSTRSSIINVLRVYEGDFFRTAGSITDIVELEKAARTLRLQG